MSRTTNVTHDHPNASEVALTKMQRLRAWWAEEKHEIRMMLKTLVVSVFTITGFMVLGYFAARAWFYADGDVEIESGFIMLVFAVVGVAFLVKGVFTTRHTLVSGQVEPSQGVARLRPQTAEDFQNLVSEGRYAALRIVIGKHLGFKITQSDIRFDPSAGIGWAFDASGMTHSDARFASLTFHLAGLIEGDPVTITSTRDSDTAVSLATQIIAAGQAPTRFEGQLELSALIEQASTHARELATEHAVTISQIAMIHAKTHVLDERLINELMTPISA